MRTTRFSFGRGLALAAACLAAAPAFAGDAKLAWHDLDLTTEAGKAELDHRIDAAAQQLCTAKPVTGTLLAPRATPRCLADAKEALNARIAAKLDRGKLAASGSGADARR